jgi:type VI secretion system protein VasD
MRLRKSICVILSLALSACTSYSPSPFYITLKSQQWINPDEHRRPLAVVVDERLMSASFNDLWKSDQQVLGDDLLQRQEWVVIPAQEKSITIRRHPETQYLGVVALFRCPEHAVWRVVHKVTSPSLFSRPYQIRLSGTRLEVLA